MVLALALLALLMNTFINALVFRMFGETWGDSIYTGSVLAQIGEFSFVLAAVGAGSAIILPETYHLAVAVIAVSLLASPLWIAWMRKLSEENRLWKMEK